MTIREGWPCFEDWQRNRRIRRFLKSANPAIGSVVKAFEGLSAALAPVTNAMLLFTESMKQHLKDIDDFPDISVHYPEHEGLPEDFGKEQIKFPRRH